MKKEKLKLFVWEGDNVLQDYSPGMVCVLARSLGHAIELLEDKYPAYYLANIPLSKYKVITKPEAFAIYGGG